MCQRGRQRQPSAAAAPARPYPWLPPPTPTTPWRRTLPPSAPPHRDTAQGGTRRSKATACPSPDEAPSLRYSPLALAHPHSAPHLQRRYKTTACPAPEAPKCRRAGWATGWRVRGTALRSWCALLCYLRLLWDVQLLTAVVLYVPVVPFVSQRACEAGGQAAAAAAGWLVAAADTLAGSS